MWMVVAGSRSRAVSLGKEGRMVTLVPVDYEESWSDCRRSWRGPSLLLLLVLVLPVESSWKRNRTRVSSEFPVDRIHR